MILDFITQPTPLGDFSIAIDSAGAVVGTAFGGVEALHRRVQNAKFRRLEGEAREIRAQVSGYFEGRLRVFSLRLAPSGTPYQQRVWTALRHVAFGERQSYGVLAKTLDSSPRAVGRANATNPICLFIPCHRIVGADGSLTGYAFGEDIKRGLLELEALHALRTGAADVEHRAVG